MAPLAIGHWAAQLVLLPLAVGLVVEPKLQENLTTDYLDDVKAPRGDLAFAPLYPNHPTASQWEEDLLDDDESDGGFWAAQMTYDTFRVSRQNQEHEVKRLLNESKETALLLERTQKKEMAARGNLTKAFAKAAKLKSEIEVLQEDHAWTKEFRDWAEADMEHGKKEVEKLEKQIKEYQAEVKRREEILRREKAEANSTAEAKTGEQKGAVGSAKSQAQDAKDRLGSVKDELDRKTAELKKLELKKEHLEKEEEETAEAFGKAIKRLKRFRQRTRKEQDAAEDEVSEESDSSLWATKTEQAKLSFGSRLVKRLASFLSCLMFWR